MMSSREQRRRALEDIKRICEGLAREDAHVIMLSDYEVANLKSVIYATGYAAVVDRNPLMVLNNGDWIGTIYQKLPDVSHPPNVAWDELAQRAKDFR